MILFFINMVLVIVFGTCLLFTKLRIFWLALMATMIPCSVVYLFGFAFGPTVWRVLGVCQFPIVWWLVRDMQKNIARVQHQAEADRLGDLQKTSSEV